jgi:hypothetical protein
MGSVLQKEIMAIVIYFGVVPHFSGGGNVFHWKLCM